MEGWRLQWCHVTDFRAHIEGTVMVWSPGNNDISFGVVGHTERKRFLWWHAASKIILPGADTNMSRKQGQFAVFTVVEIFSHGIRFKVFLGRLVLRNLQDGNISVWVEKVCLWETPGAGCLHEQEGTSARVPRTAQSLGFKEASVCKPQSETEEEVKKQPHDWVKARKKLS